MKQISADPYSDIFDDLKETVSAYCTLLQDVEDPADSAKHFFVSVIDTMKKPVEILRLMALNWLSSADSYLQKQNVVDHDFKHSLLVATYLESFDSDSNCAEIASKLWAILRFSESAELAKDLYAAVIHEQFFVQDEAAEAINEIADEFPQCIDNLINDLFALYDKYLDVGSPFLRFILTEGAFRLFRPSRMKLAEW